MSEVVVLGWLTGAAVAVVVTLVVARGTDRRPGPADLVTWARGLMMGVVAGMLVGSLPGQPHPYAVLALAVPAVALDAVDGQLARRTGTQSAFGGRFDGETDAFTILVLSVAAAPRVGWWILLAGSARYLFGAAGWLWPWLRGPLPFRYWRKVVTATVAIVLLVSISVVLPVGQARLAAVGALALLAESFGRDVLTLWRGRGEPRGRSRRAAEVSRQPARVWRRVRSGGAWALTLGLLWFALVLPNQPERATWSSLLRLPVEVVVLAGVALVVPRRAAVLVGRAAGVVLGAVALLKVADLGSAVVLGRPFEVATDGSLLGSGLAFVRDSAGVPAAVGVVVAVALLVVGLLVALPWAVARVMNSVAHSRWGGGRVVAVLSTAWVLAALTGAVVASGPRVAVAGAAPYVTGKVRQSVEAVHDRAAFEQLLARDELGGSGASDPSTPGLSAPDLSGFAGKDVVVAFVESYGRVAIEGPGSSSITDLLRARTSSLEAQGFSTASAWLTSPTFGGSSWLAHATLESGLPVTDQQRYDRLLASDRTTLSSAFAAAGWRSVALLPSTHGNWPEGRRFYRFDTVYGRDDLGYRGPTFGFSAMPDQFALAALDRLELNRADREPVFAQVELSSSHGPWAPLPQLVDPARLGDGSVFRDLASSAVSAADLWRDRERVPAAYRASIEYSLTSLLDFVARHDAVVIMLGDHQPATVVSGFGGNRDVPVSIIARDPRVAERAAQWGWTPGLVPSDAAPVWPMADVRNHLLTPTPHYRVE